MSGREWERVKQEQLKRYYRPTGPATPERPGVAAHAEGVHAGPVTSEPSAGQSPARRPSRSRAAPKEPVPHDPFNVDLV